MPEPTDAGIPTDVDLVLALRARDAKAFAALFERYFEPLVRFGYHLLGSRDAAKDAVQDIFVRVWERPELLDPSRSLKQYLYTAVRNRALDERKREVVRSRHHQETLAIASDDREMLETPSPENAVLSAATLQAAMEQLPERRREVVRLRMQEQLTYEEIAKILDTSPVAAERLVFRALADLRKILRVSG